MAVSHPIPVESLRQLLRMDPETGRLYWLPRGVEWFKDGAYSAARACAIWNGRFAGTEALTAPDGHGYRAGRIFGRHYQAHRVVFTLHNGRWPVGLVDHEDTDTTNNRPLNLRESTKAQNGQNSGGKGGTSGYCGVSWHKMGSKWHASCRDQYGIKRHLGLFSDEMDAARAYDDFARSEHGEFARLNFP